MFRLNLAGVLLLLSTICGTVVWIYSFVVIMGYLGWVAIFLLFIFRFVAPIAIIGLLFTGQWAAAGLIAAGLFFTYGMRFYAVRLGQPSVKKEQPRSDFIDVSYTVE